MIMADEITIREQLEERFGLSSRAARFAVLQVGKAGDSRSDGERYSAAGFKALGKTARTSAARLMKSASFQEALAFARAELGAIASEAAGERRLAINRARAVELLSMFAEGHLGKVLGDEMAMTPERWRDLSEDDRRLVHTLEVTSESSESAGDGSEVRFKVKLQDPLKALSQLARLEGWDAPIAFKDATPPEVKRQRAEASEALLDEIRRRKAKARGGS